MNKLEKKIYDLLKGNPRIKLFIRNIYQILFDLVPDKNNYFINQPICKKGYFFGFHDLTPFSVDDSKVLANRLHIPLRMPSISDNLSVGYFSGPTMNEFIKIGETKAWNYHKGCRLQWLGKCNRVIYNILDVGVLKSKLMNIEKNKDKIIDWPIDTASNDGNLATSFSYERLNSFMPGYGYLLSDDSFLNKLAPKETGLFIIDLKNNSRKLNISLDELSKLRPESSMDNSKHFVTHSLFSSDDKYVSFLHRWIKSDVTKRWTRLITVNIESGEVFVSPTSEMVSHYIWHKTRNEILAFCRIENIDSHVIFTTPTMNEYKRVAFPKLNSDGHQSFTSDSDFVTDTYPNARRYAQLYHVNIETNNIEKIAELKAPKKFQTRNPYKHWACDLHPRASNNGNYVCFDSVHLGERALCIMKIQKK